MDSPTRNNLPRAVLWDLDGTLIDSEELHWLAWRDTMAAEGIDLMRDQFLSTFGQRNDSILPSWLPAASPERRIVVGDAKEESYRSLVRGAGIVALPGAAEWVQRLSGEGWRQAVASSAPRPNIEVVLEVLGLARFFRGDNLGGRCGARQAGSRRFPRSGGPARRSACALYCR